MVKLYLSLNNTFLTSSGHYGTFDYECELWLRQHKIIVPVYVEKAYIYESSSDNLLSLPYCYGVSTITIVLPNDIAMMFMLRFSPILEKEVEYFNDLS